jgi:thioredoxin reductase
MIRTIDVVVTGNSEAAVAAAIDALQCRSRVLVVLRSTDSDAARRFRRRVCGTRNAINSRLRVITSCEVVCVDGVDGVEAVVIRHVRTGRLWAVNASVFLSYNKP